MKKNNPEKLSTLELACGAAGMLCPIPVVGEALLARFFYPIIKQIPLFQPVDSKDSNFSSAVVSVCVAGIARFQMYESFYLPMMDYAQRFF